MIRERIDIHGNVRPMEPQSEMPILQVQPLEIGLIKEGPTRRWLKGQTEWDTKYIRSARKAVLRRRKIETKVERLLNEAREEGLFLEGEQPPPQRQQTTLWTPTSGTVKGNIDEHRRWGPLDLDDEQPPPSAIAKRRDTVSCIQADLIKHLREILCAMTA